MWIVDAQSGMAFLKQPGRPRLIWQRPVGQIPPKVASKRRSTDLGAARNGLARRVRTPPRLRGVPDAGQIGMPVGKARSRCSQIGFAVRFSWNAFRRIPQPLSGCNGMRANQHEKDIHQYIESPHTPCRSFAARSAQIVDTTAGTMNRTRSLRISAGDNTCLIPTLLDVRQTFRHFNIRSPWIFDERDSDAKFRHLGVGTI